MEPFPDVADTEKVAVWGELVNVTVWAVGWVVMEGPPTLLALHAGTDLGMTVRERETLCVKPPEVPVTVTVTVPVAAVAEADRVSVLELLAMGLKDGLTPLGKPEAAKLTLPLKPFTGLTVMVAVPEAPGARVKVLGEAEREKSGTELTT